MHSWIFRHREALARVYGLAPAEARRPGTTGRPRPLPEVGREVLVPARRRAG